MRLIAIGRLGRAPEAALFARYAARLRPPLALTELPDGHGAAAEIKRREADALLAALPAQAFAVALDMAGEAPGSEGLAARLAAWRDTGRKLCFLIGGAEGLDARVLARAGARLSLGPYTWPHALARVMLAEQLYRAQSILAGHPYHRGGRP
ncbi:MAG TPA: 23S rRNA (pseudouridine(1915)-N(3))-methyltransferase RlmH [Acetobacteraceae bacterium]|nr:23S rRNA (pseudouridine(1915)-N(3))-methyltransferase RlmH [Acetobacteraceae bacterium]